MKFFSMKKEYSIWVIDDDDVYQQLFTRQLKKSQIIQFMKLFSYAEDAIQTIEHNITKKEELPDFIFLDINMPVMDGWQFLDEFSKLQPRLPKPVIVYIMSSSVDSDDFERAELYDTVAQYLVKPIDLIEIEKIIEKSTLTH